MKKPPRHKTIARQQQFPQHKETSSSFQFFLAKFSLNLTIKLRRSKCVCVVGTTTLDHIFDTKPEKRGTMGGTQYR